MPLENATIDLDLRTALRDGDTLIIWNLDRLGRNLHHLINTVHDLMARGSGLKVLTGHGAAIDTITAAGKLIFGIFAALAEFEREMIRERTLAGMASARARGRKGGRPHKMTQRTPSRYFYLVNMILSSWILQMDISF